MYLSAHADARHRLLEGFVLRLARSTDADAFVLRGGMLVRQWFPTFKRPALDLDLACALPFRTDDLRRYLMAVLAERSVADAVVFHLDRVRIDPIWVETAAPGLRLFSLGTIDGQTVELRVDVTFGLDLWPTPERSLFEAQRGCASVWMCHPASIVGRKLQVIAARGHRHWRPKDLNDIRMVLADIPIEGRTLCEAIEASLVGCGQSLDDVREAFATKSWWNEPRAHARWLHFLQDTEERFAPDDVADAVAEVSSRLRPLLGHR